MLQEQYRILVKEKIAEAGVDMLRERFAVDVEVLAQGVHAAVGELLRDEDLQLRGGHQIVAFGDSC